MRPDLPVLPHEYFVNLAVFETEHMRHVPRRSGELLAISSHPRPNWSFGVTAAGEFQSFMSPPSVRR
jgi:hypothetical protein